MKDPELPITKDCHCDHTAHKYRTRKFTNQLGYLVYRVYYRCENCLSRIHEDFIPEMDNMKKIDVMDFRNNLHLFNKVD